MLVTSALAVFPYLVPLLLFVVAIVLVRKYVRSRDPGLIWLVLAVVAWPLLFRALEHPIVARLVKGHQAGQATLGSLVLAIALLQQFIGVCLLLVAALYLYKSRLPGANL
jgi:hypothetical protein